MHGIQLDPIVKKFFTSFSRLEYALKRAGHVKSRGRNGAAEPNWTEFAERVQDKFEGMMHSPEHPQLAQAVEFIRNVPPRKLVLIEEDGIKRLYWKVSPPTGANLDELLTLVKRIRNNLFHGEKPETLVGGNRRGAELITAAQEIIDTCISLDRTVHRYFARSSPRVPRLNPRD